MSPTAGPRRQGDSGAGPHLHGRHNDADQLHRLTALLIVVAFVMAWLIVASTTLGVAYAQTPPGTYAPPSPSSTLSDQELQRQKLQLEITKLRQDTSNEALFRSYIPLLSVLAALVAGGFGIYKFASDRKRDYSLRIEQEVNSNIQYLTEYPKKDHHLNALAATALDSLTWLVEQTADPSRYRSRITAAIASEVQDDIDFDSPEQSRFDSLCLKHWRDYGQHLVLHPETHDFVLYRYRQALLNLREGHHEYFTSIHQNDEGTYEVPRYIEESKYRHFLALVDGYVHHVALIDSEEFRRRAIVDFSEALQNPRLTRQLFETGSDGGNVPTTGQL